LDGDGRLCGADLSVLNLLRPPDSSAKGKHSHPPEQYALLATLFVRPVVRDKRRRLRPRSFYENFLEPVISKIGVLSHYDLKSWNQLWSKLQKPRKQPPNSD